MVEVYRRPKPVKVPTPEPELVEEKAKDNVEESDQRCVYLHIHTLSHY